MLGAGGGPGGAGTGASVPAGGKTQTQALKNHFCHLFYSILLCFWWSHCDFYLPKT